MDAASFEQLLRHAHFARGVARALVDDEHLADDVVQETWLAAVRRPPRVLSAAWIGTVAANAARKLRRGASRRAAREAAAAAPHEEAAFWRPDQQAILREVVDAVLALDEPYRSTVLLRFYEAVPPREIAVRQGVSVNTVNSRLQRALALLRDRLDEGRGRGAWAGALVVFAARGSRRSRPQIAGPLLTGAIMGAGVKVAASCAAVVLAALLVWRWADDAAPPPEMTVPLATPVLEPGPGTGRRRAEVAAADASADHDASPAKAAAAGAAPADSAAVIEGRVAAEAGPLPSRGVAYVSAGTDGERRVLARADLAADGSFRFELRPPVGGDGLDAEVGAFVPGFVRTAESLRLDAGVHHVAITLRRGCRIAGMVQTAGGSTVPDLPLLLLPAGRVPRVITDRDIDLDAWLAKPHSPAAGWARATTDGAGRFVAEGLTRGTAYVLFSESSEWMLRTDGAVPEGAESVHVVAVPSRRVLVRVSSAATGDRVPSDATLAFSRRTSRGKVSIERSLGRQPGEFAVRWGSDDESETIAPGALPGDADHPVEVELRLRAEGFQARTLNVTNLGAATGVLEVELDPVVDADVGSLELEVVDSRGDPVDEELRARLYARRSGSDVNDSPGTCRFSRSGPGRFVVSATPGRWRLVLAPAAMPITDASFTTDVELIAGATSNAHIVLPASGWLVFRSKGTPDLVVGASNAQGSVSQALGQDGTTRLRLKAGTWTATIGTGAATRTREITVSPFEETVIDIDE